MLKIAIVVTERCQASSVHTMLDMLMAANFVGARYFNTGRKPLFETKLVGLRTAERAYNGYEVTQLETLQQVKRPHIALLPGAFEAVVSDKQACHLLDQLQALYPVLARWHKAGCVIGSVCTGNFVLARAGLSSGRTLTCHWASEDTANRLFPTEHFVSQQMLIDHGDVISAGGALAVTQLMLYLLQRWHSREMALATAKLMMVEPSLDSQCRFAIFSPGKDHGDKVVAAMQTLIEQRFNEALPFAQFADRHGLTERHLNRRFKKHTGETPLSYQQRVCIEKVKAGLEASTQSLSQLVWDVGYEDLTSFRRLFKRHTGMTMQVYRDRFGSARPLLTH